MTIEEFNEVHYQAFLKWDRKYACRTEYKDDFRPLKLVLNLKISEITIENINKCNYWSTDFIPFLVEELLNYHRNKFNNEFIEYLK